MGKIIMINQIKKARMKLTKEARIGLSETERQVLFDKILEIINSFKDDKLKTALLDVIVENEILFKIAPAAKTYCHYYIGGLMQHILECVKLSNALVPRFPLNMNINNELVLAACIAHDLGNIFEYKVDLESGIVEINEKFINEWISHIEWGFSWAYKNGFYELALIIASHHGTKEYSDLVDLMMIEADLLYEIVKHSSRPGRIEKIQPKGFMK